MPARDGALSSVRRASLSAAGSLRRTHCARVLPRSGSGNDIDRAPDAGPVRNRPNAQCVCPCSRVLPAAPGITAPAIARIPTSRRSRRTGPLPAAGQGPRQTCTQLARSRTALGGPITLGVGVEGRAAIDPRGLTKTAGPSRFIRSIDAIFPDAPPAHGAVRRDDTESDPDVCTVKPTVMPDHREDAKESVHARP